MLLWTCFPEAYASITLTLFVPLTLAALGIVLRGASFAFRKAVFRTRDRRNFGAAFAVSSVLVPYCLGAVVGGIASGRVPAGGKAGDPWDSWVNPTSDPRRRARRVPDRVPRRVLPGPRRRPALRRDDGRLLPAPRHRGRRGRRRWWRSAGIFVLSNDAEYLFDGLTSRALPLVILSAVCGLAALVLVTRAPGAARAWPPSVRWPASSSPGGSRSGTTCCPTRLTVSAAAAPSGTITAVLVATGLAAVLIVPAFVLLYVLDQKTLLPEESMPEPTP